MKQRSKNKSCSIARKKNLRMHRLMQIAKALHSRTDKPYVNVSFSADTLSPDVRTIVEDYLK